MKEYIQKTSQIAIASISAITAGGLLAGCESHQQEAQNMFIVLQQKADGSYDVIEIHPTDGPSRAIVRDLKGNERMMSNEEMTALAQQEAQKIDNGTSNMGHGGGMSMGEAILAAATGAILGNMIGNALANKMNNNQRFQSAQRQSANKTSAYTRSAKSKSASKTSKSRSGFFGKSKNSTRSGRSRGFLGG